MITRITVTLSKSLDGVVANKQRLLAQIGQRAARMLRSRIEREGRDHEGRPLPQLKQDRWFFTTALDPRFAGDKSLVPRFDKGQKSGPPGKIVHLPGYRELKRRMSGGRTWRGASLTGAMWANLQVKIVPAARKGFTLVLWFARGERVGYKAGTAKGKKRGKVVSIRHRDKAWRLQYPRREKRDGANRPAGKREFKLMWLSASELNLLESMWTAGVRLFRSGTERF